MATPKTYIIELENNEPVFKIRQMVELDEPIERDGETITHKLKKVDAEGNVPQEIVDYLHQRYSDRRSVIMDRLGEDDESKLVLKTGTISFNSTGDPVVGDGLRGVVRFYHNGKLRTYKLHEKIPKDSLE